MFDIPLRKIDEERRLVIGQAAAEGKDRSGESMDYASAKEAFRAWSDEFDQSTGGLSKGNLRVMHTKEVAGKIIDLSFDDATRAVNVVAYVASDNAWNLVKSGCFSGFSIGGGYAKRWTDEDGLKKYTPIVREISLVDNPCIPTARFVELIKADGIIEQIELRPRTHGFEEMWKARPLSFFETWVQRPKTFGDLAKLGSWSEHKHPRAHGKFSSSKAAGADSTSSDSELKASSAVSGFAEGAIGARVALSALQDKPAKMYRAIRYGRGETGARNKIASDLRSSPALRAKIVEIAGAHRARIADPGVRQTIASRAVKALTGQMVNAKPPPLTLRRGLIHVGRMIPMSIAGGILGQQAVYRLQHENDGTPISGAHTLAASVGDGLRALRLGGEGAMAGAVAALPISYGLARLRAQPNSIGRYLEHATRGAIAGAVGSLALTVPALVREYRTRHFGAQE